ncbi:MAG: peptide-methionine (S)-S-oxide reductase MsrA [Chthoniobacterales bacterium]|nr:peptide-methionine (S)-S-oxide reductase MsrA [Chthoniobacterales bacterium]
MSSYKIFLLVSSIFISIIPTMLATETTTTKNEEKAYLGGGCFWCMEALFQKLPGVISVKPGYAGGSMKDPTYEKVCQGETGHAEVIEIIYDPQKISYNQLLDLFWRAHDPTTWNQQGADLGPQYRSVIFTISPEQHRLAETSKKDAQEYFNKPIVTEIKPLSHFYPAEKYHQNYYQNNRNAPYCRAVIAPKLKKLHMD